MYLSYLIRGRRIYSRVFIPEYPLERFGKAFATDGHAVEQEIGLI